MYKLVVASLHTLLAIGPFFFKQGSYKQTNGKSPAVNRNWCSGAETHGGDIKKQYEDGNYAEVWFRKASIYVSPAAVSNKGYFTKND